MSWWKALLGWVVQRGFEALAEKASDKAKQKAAEKASRLDV